MAEDYNMWDDILKHSKGINLPEILTYYRRGSNNDSKRNYSLTQKEGDSIRHKICVRDNYLCKREMLMILDIEEKRRKGIIDLFMAYKLYMKYLKANLDKSNQDYAIILNQIAMRLLGKFIVDNETAWANVCNKLYRTIRSVMYRFAK